MADQGGATCHIDELEPVTSRDQLGIVAVRAPARGRLHRDSKPRRDRAAECDVLVALLRRRRGCRVFRRTRRSAGVRSADRTRHDAEHQHGADHHCQCTTHLLPLIPASVRSCHSWHVLTGLGRPHTFLDPARRGGSSSAGGSMNRFRIPVLLAAVGACVLTTTLAAGAQGGSGVRATITGPIPDSSGNGQAPPNLPKDVAKKYGYVEEEYFVSGDATSYLPVSAPGADGRWEVAPAGTAPYTTRIKVRRPKDMHDFSGTSSSSGTTSPWGSKSTPTSDRIPRVGREGRCARLRVGTSRRRERRSGPRPRAPGAPPLEATLPLKSRDPVRYAKLSHPGDDYSYDIVTQVGRLAQSGDLTKGKKPDHVMLMGESQSAGRIATYANVVQPIAKVYDGILIHSRGPKTAPIAAAEEAQHPAVTIIRTDLDIPVFQFETEGDVSGTGQFVLARQPNSRRLRTWEVAGTAHADDSIATAGKRALGVKSFDIVAVCGGGQHRAARRGAPRRDRRLPNVGDDREAASEAARARDRRQRPRARHGQQRARRRSNTRRRRSHVVTAECASVDEPHLSALRRDVPVDQGAARTALPHACQVRRGSHQVGRLGLAEGLYREGRPRHVHHERERSGRPWAETRCPPSLLRCTHRHCMDAPASAPIPRSSSSSPSESVATRSPPERNHRVCAAWMTPPVAAASISALVRHLAIGVEHATNSTITRWVFS